MTAIGDAEVRAEVGSLLAAEGDRSESSIGSVIGEAANRIHKIAPDFEAKHPELPWIEMRGMRNKVIHDYFDIDWPTVWDTVKDDLPLLLKQIKSLLSMPPNPV